MEARQVRRRLRERMSQLRILEWQTYSCWRLPQMRASAARVDGSPAHAVR